MNKIEDFFKLLPQHYQKEGTLKYYETIKPIFKYLDDLVSEEIGMLNIKKAYGRYLDYIGYKMQVLRNEMTDSDYKKILEMQRFKYLNIPTTEGLIKLAEKMTGYVPKDIIFRPKNEPASQYFRYELDSIQDINKFFNLNSVCDAGARMYWDLKILDDTMLGNFISVIDIRKKIELVGDFEVDQKVKIEQMMNFAAIFDIRKKIEIRGNV